jgi:hypothetical protein
MKQGMKAKCVSNIHNVVIFSIATTVIRLYTISTLIMTPKMNNNNRKNLSKTIAMAGMGFLLIAGAFTFSFANSGQQLVYAQQQGGNATTTIVATPFDTFSANGVITATIGGGGGGGGGNQTAGGGGGNQTAGGGGGNQTAGGGGGGNQTAGGGGGNQTAGGGGGNQTAGGGGGNQTAGGGGGNQTAGGGGQEAEYILGGNWNLNVESGNVTGFTANFIMVHPDGTEYHTHNITNFAITGGGTVQLVQGQETSISGTADIYTNGTNRWPGADTTLTLTDNAAVMTIMPAAEDTENHFQGQPIYGIVAGATGENGTTIVQTTPPGQQQQEEEEEGGPLSALTEPFQDLFGGGQ